MRTVRARYGVTGPKVTNAHQPAKEQRKPKERTAKNTEEGEIVEGPAVADKAGEGVDKAENPVVADKAEETIAAQPPVEDEAPVETDLPAAETAAEQLSTSKAIQEEAKSAKGRLQGISSEVTALICGFETASRFSAISELEGEQILDNVSEIAVDDQWSISLSDFLLDSEMLVLSEIGDTDPSVADLPPEAAVKVRQDPAPTEGQVQPAETETKAGEQRLHRLKEMLQKEEAPSLNRKKKRQCKKYFTMAVTMYGFLLFIILTMARMGQWFQFLVSWHRQGRWSHHSV
ncbi:hypothetical protein EOD39_1861 [Acipenser ruthenus]|uniref:Uncharacterized protein n=1 Tax=Acipenser ruthenus TaxID=7906 RepID=A0A444U6Q2_ACIRT|nr:hypothetical protein EOD39_1861 [Acipenser ruthenus]